MSAVVRARSARAALSAPRSRAFARAAVGAVILAAIIVQAGAEPFIRGLASVSVPAIAAALALTATAMAAAAWRWRILARRLGLPLGGTESVSAYYRSGFLNTVLPGGVIGDVHRAIAHGQGVGRIAQASRAVAAERAAGQAVQLALAVVVLVSLGVAAYSAGVGIMLLAVVAVCAGVVVAAALSTRARTAIRRELTILRDALGSVGTVAKVIAASLIVVAGHAATFVVACLAVGVEAAPARVVGLALIVVLAGSIPLNIGGWGPREGIAAWAFAAAGLGAATGIAASTAYGVLAMIAVLPGAAVIAASAHRRRGGLSSPERGSHPA